MKMYVQVDFCVYGIASLKAFLHLFLLVWKKRMLGFIIFQVRNNLMHLKQYHVEASWIVSNFGVYYSQIGLLQVLSFV